MMPLRNSKIEGHRQKGYDNLTNLHIDMSHLDISIPYHLHDWQASGGPTREYIRKVCWRAQIQFHKMWYALLYIPSIFSLFSIYGDII